jgi:YegS/Rv2252/BmrU family lipid kinase
MSGCHHVDTTSHVTVILNASAGGSGKEKEAVPDRLAEVFQSSRLDAQICLAHSGKEIVELACHAARQGDGIIVAGGGDGTINAVASALVGTDTALGILPLGTRNHFAKDLQIPLDLESAARTITAGRMIHVDVGEVNGRVFLNNASLGIYPRIVEAREEHQRRGRRKWLAFCLAALTVLRRYPLLRVRVSVDGHELVRTTPIIFVGNNEYALEGLNMGARQCLDKGCLSVYVLHRTGRWGLLRLALHRLFGKQRDADGFDALCTRELRVEARRMRKRMRVALDGEITTMHAPLQYRIRPAALRVIVPPIAAEIGR